MRRRAAIGGLPIKLLFSLVPYRDVNEFPLVSVIQLQFAAVAMFLLALIALLHLRKRRQQTSTKSSTVTKPRTLESSLSDGQDFRMRYPANFRTDDGHYVRSKAELLIDNWLYKNDLAHEYEKEIPNELMMCDFYLPDSDVYIEFWGGGTLDYETRKKTKLQSYERLRLRLISLTDVDIQRLESNLTRKLGKYRVRLH